MTATCKIETIRGRYEETDCECCGCPLDDGDSCVRALRPDGIRTYCSKLCATEHDSRIDRALVPND